MPRLPGADSVSEYESRMAEFIVDRIEQTQKCIAMRFSLLSVVVAVSLGWLLSRTDVHSINNRIDKMRCDCRHSRDTTADPRPE